MGKTAVEIVMGVTLGLLCLTPLVVALVRNATDPVRPRIWPLWLGYAFGALVLGLFFLFGINGAWLGCARAGEPRAIQCTRGAETCDPSASSLCRPGGDWCAPGPNDAGEACAPGWTPKYEYCEAIGTGWIAQAQNTWSDLGFMASGLFVLLLVSFGSHPRARYLPRNPMTAPSVFSIMYGLIVIFMGPASMWLHASMKSWAGFFDNYSILLWLWFNATYTIIRTARLDAAGSAGLFGAVYGAGVVGAAIISLAVGGRDIMVYVAVGVWFACEGVFIGIAMAERRFSREQWYLVGALASLGVALIFKLVWDGTSACDPNGAFQGHAWWHILAALGTFFTFLYFRSERDATGA